MKIVQVSPTYPPNIGGVQNVARDLSEGLAIKGHEIRVLTSDVGIGGKKLKSKKNLKIKYLKGVEVAHTVIIPSLFIHLLTIARESVVHVHIAQAFAPEVVFLASKIKKFRYVSHFHLDVDPSGKMGFLLPIYKQLILKRILKSSSKIVVLADVYRDFIKKEYGVLENIKVIPNGVNEKYFVKRRKDTKHRMNLLTVGRLSEQKDVPKLVMAMSMLKRSAILHVVGSGDQKEEINKLIKKLKLNNVMLHGNKTGESLLDYYRKASIFLLASKKEGLPLVLLEAMSAGVPIIASDVIGNHEFVGSDGVLVNPPNASNFASAIDSLIDNKQLRNVLSARGEKRANLYRWNKIINMFENLYKEISNESE